MRVGDRGRNRAGDRGRNRGGWQAELTDFGKRCLMRVCRGSFRGVVADVGAEVVNAPHGLLRPKTPD